MSVLYHGGMISYSERLSLGGRRKHTEDVLIFGECALEIGQWHEVRITLILAFNPMVVISRLVSSVFEPR